MKTLTKKNQRRLQAYIDISHIHGEAGRNIIIERELTMEYEEEILKNRYGKACNYEKYGPYTHEISGESYGTYRIVLDNGKFETEINVDDKNKYIKSRIRDRKIEEILND